MFFMNWKALLPPRPVVPPRLWLTVGIIAVASLNLIFSEEIWPHTPQAGGWWVMILLGTVVIGLPQVWLMLWRWAGDYAGPWWLAGLWRLALVAVVGGLVLLETGLVIYAIFRLGT